MNVDAISIPEEAGICVERYAGDSQLAFFLVDAQAGHPPESERRVMAALEALHAERPIERVFMNFDASGKSGSFEEEIDVAPYRAFPNPEVTKGITQTIIDQGVLAGGKAFAIVSEPAAKLHAIDDWYGWAAQKDALNELNAEVGKIVLGAQVAGALIPGDEVQTLLSFVRLDLTAGEWRGKRAAVTAIDPAATLADLEPMMPEFEAMVAAFIRYTAAAWRFYAAGTARTELLVRDAIHRMRQAGDTTGAITLALPWMDAATPLLREEQVGFVRVTPDGVEMASMLNEASVAVGDLSDSTQNLVELFSGERIRGRIERLRTKEQEERKRRAQDWVVAGQNLSQIDAARASECINRALELDPSAETHRVAGGHAVDHSQYELALAHYEASLALDARNPSTWEGYGLALDGIGQHGPARKAILRSVYLAPGNGQLWGRLGFHDYHYGPTEVACYSLRRGRELGDSASAENFAMVCGSRDGRFSTPLAVRPSVIFVMHRIVLPVRHLLRRGAPSRRGARLEAA